MLTLGVLALLMLVAVGCGGSAGSTCTSGPAGSLPQIQSVSSFGCAGTGCGLFLPMPPNATGIVQCADEPLGGPCLHLSCSDPFDNPAFKAQINVSGGQCPLTYQMSGNNLSGLSINSSTGVLSFPAGDCGQEGTSETVVFTVTDSAGNKSTPSMTLGINLVQ
jgi:hypothetical protein